MEGNLFYLEGENVMEGKCHAKRLKVANPDGAPIKVLVALLLHSLSLRRVLLHTLHTETG